ncbi:MAG TPA: hypothetical protein VE685_16250 [Thermoanaerobaculia bacterium]|nr:hypothetical protein [Thermoanaerobaculia bacterium]
MADIRVQRKKGIPLIWLVLALIILILAIWFLVDRMGDDENASLTLPEPWLLAMAAAGGAEAPQAAPV